MLDKSVSKEPPYSDQQPLDLGEKLVVSVVSRSDKAAKLSTSANLGFYPGAGISFLASLF